MGVIFIFIIGSGGLLLNISSALIRQVISLEDSDTWSNLRRDYLPSSYHRVFGEIEKHQEKYHQLPSFDDLRLSIRDANTKEKVLAIESVDIDVDPHTLLEYLKNEYAQRLILNSLDGYIDSTVAFADASESLEALHDIILDVENKVDTKPPEQSMQRISLFESDEELSKYVALGLNEEYDAKIKFSPIDLILVGGPRGAGKSLTCANVVNNMYNSGKSAIYFTIEMDATQTLQRICSVATGVCFARLKVKTLSVTEWEKVVEWWANRFEDSERVRDEYIVHRDFDKFHKELTHSCLLKPKHQIDVVYDQSLTLGKIRAELDKKVASMNVGLIVVDYLNQVKRSNAPSRGGQYDWMEQIEVSKALKVMAQEYKVPVFSPYQTDATGEARFAKGILDAADAAFALDAHTPDDSCMTFDCVKMRNNPEDSFTSVIDWNTLQIGPETAIHPGEVENEAVRSEEDINDL